MENHFRVSGVLEKEWVYSIIANMDPIHFPPCHKIHKEASPLFRSKVISMFRKPDVSEYLIPEWSEMRQKTDEDLPRSWFGFRFLERKRSWDKLTDRSSKSLYMSSAPACVIKTWLSSTP